MKNKEKYANEIMEVIITGNQMAFDVTKGTVTTCCDTYCDQCLFDEGCDECSDEAIADTRRKWLEEEYVESEIDWRKVPVDTPILVRDSEYGEWKERYFAAYDDGIVYAWVDGITSSISIGSEDMLPWKYAKLLED